MTDRGGVLLEAIVAIVIFMTGSVAVVLLFNHSLQVLSEVELEGRVVPEVAGIIAGDEDEGERELERGVIRWVTDEGIVEVEFVPDGADDPALRWELGR